MYIFPEMIKMGLKDGQKFPSKAHKQVASTIGLCNSFVTQRDILTDIVQAVIRVPKNKIELITLEELAKDYNCPVVW